MSQALSYQDKAYSRDRHAGRISTRAGTFRPEHRHRPIEEPAAVPALDWPRDLFADSASVGELVMVDFLMQCDTEMPFSQDIQTPTSH